MAYATGGAIKKLYYRLENISQVLHIGFDIYHTKDRENFVCAFQENFTLKLYCIPDYIRRKYIDDWAHCMA